MVATANLPLRASCARSSTETFAAPRKMSRIASLTLDAPVAAPFYRAPGYALLLACIRWAGVPPI